MNMIFFALSKDEFTRAQNNAEEATKVFEAAKSVEVDYLTISAAVEGMAEATGEGEAEPEFDEEGEMDHFEGNYGAATFWSPSKLGALEESSGWEVAAELEPDLKKLLAKAKKGQLYVVAVVD